jgi:hypothetical protein
VSRTSRSSRRNAARGHACGTRPSEVALGRSLAPELSKAGKFVDEWLLPWRENHALARSAEGIGRMCYSNPGHPTDEAIECYFAPLMSSRRRKHLAHAYATSLERNPLIGIDHAQAEQDSDAHRVGHSGHNLCEPQSRVPGSHIRRFSGCSTLAWSQTVLAGGAPGNHCRRSLTFVAGGLGIQAELRHAGVRHCSRAEISRHHTASSGLSIRVARNLVYNASRIFCSVAEATSGAYVCLIRPPHARTPAINDEELFP